MGGFLDDLWRYNFRVLYAVGVLGYRLRLDCAFEFENETFDLGQLNTFLHSSGGGGGGLVKVERENFFNS